MIFHSFITKEKIEEFTADAVNEIKFQGDYFYVKFYTDYMGPSPEFHVDDFSFKGINSFSYIDLSKNWREFMLASLPDAVKVRYMKEFNALLDNEKLTLSN